MQGAYQGSGVRANHQMYVEFEYLWCTDLNKYFKDFLAQSWVENVDDDGNPVGKKRLNLDRFDEEIKRFRDVQATIGALHSSTDIDFLRIRRFTFLRPIDSSVGM